MSCNSQVLVFRGAQEPRVGTARDLAQRRSRHTVMICRRHTNVRIAREFEYDRVVPGEWTLPHHERQQKCHLEPQFVESGRKLVRHLLLLDISSTTLLITALGRRLYIDQPVGVGFSHGTTTVGTSQQAAADVWKVRPDRFVRGTFRHLHSCSSCKSSLPTHALANTKRTTLQSGQNPMGDITDLPSLRKHQATSCCDTVANI